MEGEVTRGREAGSKRKEENKTTTTIQNYIFKKRMKDIATSKVNWVTELRHCVIDFASRTTAT